MLFVIGAPVDSPIPKDAVDSTETLMENAKVTDKIDQMTDGPIESSSGDEDGQSVAKAVQRLTPDADTVAIV